jgi:hypothetical protein
MRKTSPLHRLLILPMLFGIFLFSSCSSSDGIDNYFTFNYAPESAFVVFSFSTVGQNNQATSSLAPDSAILNEQGTTRELINSIKLTKLSFEPGEAAYDLSNFDSIAISISADSLPDALLGIYNGTTDSVTLTEVDIAPYLKKASQSFLVNYRINKAPSTTEPIIFNYTLVYTARPKE